MSTAARVLHYLIRGTDALDYLTQKRVLSIENTVGGADVHTFSRSCILNNLTFQESNNLVMYLSTTSSLACSDQTTRLVLISNDRHAACIFKQ